MNVAVQHRDADLRRDVVSALTSLGVLSTDVASQRELRSLLEESHFDALLVEVEAQRGVEERRWLSAICSALPVVGLCSDRRASAVVEALRLGFTGLLGMPVHLMELEQSLSRSLLRGDGPDPRDGARDPSVRALQSDLARAATSDATVVVVGEGDTGRRRVAGELHDRSRRNAGPLVVLPCAGISEAELLGSPNEASGPGCAGALTRARGGTLVLHEITELPSALQELLLEGLMAAGAAPKAGGPRLVATARTDLSADPARSRLLPNLRRRLDVVTLRVPPLRERPQELIDTARAMLRRLGRSLDLPVPELSPDAEAQLLRLPLRGNHAELEGYMRRAVLLAPGRVLDRLPGVAVDEPMASDSKEAPEVPGFDLAGGATLDLRTLERETIARSLRSTQGNRTHAARALGISVRTLRDKIRRYGLAESNPPGRGGASADRDGQILPPDPSV